MSLFSMNSQPTSNALHSLFFPWQLFKGKFFYCLGPDIKNITNKSDCLQANYKWVHHKYNFDNLGQVCVCVCPRVLCVCVNVCADVFFVPHTCVLVEFRL